MVGQNTYVPPPYIPLGQSDVEADSAPPADAIPASQHIDNVPGQWSSGICACFDDMQSCCVGLFCPCYLFGKNSEFLGSGTLMGSCMTHFILWALVNTLCCVLTEGIMLGLPGCFVACYACGYRRTLRSNYNLQINNMDSKKFCGSCNPTLLNEPSGIDVHEALFEWDKEAPCGDFITHFFCHLCAICQEYREIRDRSRDLNSASRNTVEVTAPTVQIMESASAK